MRKQLKCYHKKSFLWSQTKTQ